MTKARIRRGARRLLKLADFLEKFKEAPDHQFNMDHYATRPTSGGTAACAMGWATEIPSFRRAGLKIRYSVLHFEKLRGVNAVMEFFSISSLAAGRIIYPGSYPRYQRDDGTNRKISRYEVCRRIRKTAKAMLAQVQA